MDGVLNGSGERFQNNAVSVTKFTCFVLTEGGFVKKIVCGFKNILHLTWPIAKIILRYVTS